MRTCESLNAERCCLQGRALRLQMVAIRRSAMGRYVPEVHAEAAP